MKKRPEQGLFEEVARIKSMAEAFVEKDWFVTQVIASIATIHQTGFDLVFTGGTALSKAHHLLARFSEDIDFRIIAAEERQDRKELSSFKKFVVDALHQDGFDLREEDVKARDQNRFFSIDLEYPSYFTRANALRPHIQVEMTARAMQLQPINLPVSSFINEIAQKPPEVPLVGCIDPVESAADKLSAITWRIPDRVRGDQYDDPSIVRHLYDLALLKERALTHPAFANLVVTSMHEDDDRPKTNAAFSGKSVIEKLNLMMQILNDDKEYAAEYDRFVKGVSYAPENETPRFSTAMQIVQEIVRDLSQNAT